MMLDHIGESAAARRIERAVWVALEEGDLPIDGRGRASRGTRAAAEAIAGRI